MKYALHLAIGLLARAKKNGITVLPEGDQLLVRSPRNIKPDPALLQELKMHKTAILRFFETAGSNLHLVNHTPNPIPPADRHNNIPASFAQERLWTIDQLRGSVDYHLPVLVRFSGKPDEPALIYSLQQVINRHGVLRTVFCEWEGVLLQQLMPPDNWSLWPVDSRINKADFLKTFTGTPFRLAHDSVIRAALFQQSDGEYVLALTLHHIASDGWSVAIMIREIVAGYNAFKRGIPYQPEPLELQYTDYAVWQRQQYALQSDTGLAYWEQQLRHAAPMELPGDFSRHSLTDNAGAVMRFSFDPSLVQALKTFSNRQGATLFTTLLTTFQLLLARYTGQEDISVGTPVVNRDTKALQQLIGLFVNTIVIRSQVKDHLSFEDLLQQVKGTVRDGFAHGNIPFEKVIDQLVKERDGSRSPLFQAVITLQEYHQLNHVTLDGLKVQVEELETGTAKFDCTFAFMEGEDSLHLRIEYSTRLYCPERIQRMFHHFRNLLQAAMAHPNQPVKELLLTSPEEMEQLLQQAYFPASFPAGKTITDLLEEQVAKTPLHTALVFEDRTVSYENMNGIANQVARYLQEQYTIEADTLVAVLLERSEWMPIVLAGILKAGAAYVPIDPGYPKERIDFILADSGCAFVFDETELQRFQLSAGKYSTTNPARRYGPANLAYVIYTSGTTGKPKGVLIEHRQVVRLLVNDAFQFHFNKEDVWTMFHSYCFDFSVWEMYGALVHGSKLIIVPAWQAQDTASFLNLLQRHQVTILNQTPSAFYNLDNQVHLVPGALLHLRYIIFGGEALNPMRLKRWKARFPHTKLINMYGITETTVHVTYYEITEKNMHRQNSIIGRSIPTLGCYVLDAHQQLLPAGIPGELYVGGEGVARGYLNNETLTAARFISNPYKTGDRLYRTGDKVQLLEDGNLEYLGRLDQQVKIRGYRIEPAEIEAVLLQHDNIEEAVVIARALQDGEMELVAYYTGSASIDPGEVRRWVLSQLPGYMLPAHFVQLDKLPVTTNGKTDKKNLPDPHLVLAATNSYKAPSNETEEKLVLLWQQLLQVEPIGVHDHFFEIGGNSLKLVKMVGLVNEHFQTSMAVVTAFSYPNIRALAGYLNALHQPAAVTSPRESISEGIQIMHATLDILNNKQ